LIHGNRTGLGWLAGWTLGGLLAAQLKPIKLPNPLLHLISDAVKLQSKLGIGGPRGQLATTLYITLNPDQKIERDRLFHLTETSREKPRPMGIKGGANQEFGAFASNALGKSYQRLSESQVKTQPVGNKLKVLGRTLGGRFLIRSLQFLFGLMVELLVPPIRFSSLLPKFMGAAYNFDPGGPSHSSFLFPAPRSSSAGYLHDLYASYGRWAMQF
jgi:hypothetical protein